MRWDFIRRGQFEIEDSCESRHVTSVAFPRLVATVVLDLELGGEARD